MDASYLYPERVEEFSRHFSREEFSPRSISVQTIQDGVVHPFSGSWSSPDDGWAAFYGGVTDARGGYVETSARAIYSWTSGSVRTPLGVRPFDADTVKRVPRRAVYLGPFSRQWGHFNLETVARLWAFLASPELADPDVLVAYTQSKVIDGNFAIVLELAGIDVSRLYHVTQPTGFDEVVVIESSHPLGGPHTREYRDTVAAIRQAALARSIDLGLGRTELRRVYLSRTRMGRNQTIGEARIEELLRRGGWRIVYPEEMDLVTLIHVLDRAESVMCLSGSAAVNFLYCRPGTTVIVLHKHGQQLQNELGTVASAAGVDVVCVDAHTGFLPVRISGGIYMISNNVNFSRCLSDLCNEDYPAEGNTPEELQEYLTRWAMRVDPQGDPAKDTVTVGELAADIRTKFLGHLEPGLAGTDGGRPAEPAAGSRVVRAVRRNGLVRRLRGGFRQPRG